MTIAEPKAVYSRLLQILLKQDLPSHHAQEALEKLFIDRENKKGMM